jgi:hypothetical protein
MADIGHHLRRMLPVSKMAEMHLSHTFMLLERSKAPYNYYSINVITIPHPTRTNNYVRDIAPMRTLKQV